MKITGTGTDKQDQIFPVQEVFQNNDLLLQYGMFFYELRKLPKKLLIPVFMLDTYYNGKHIYSSFKWRKQLKHVFFTESFYYV